MLHKFESIISEGQAKLATPNPSLYLREDGVYEPSWAPVFYNPRMKHNRDLMILVTRTYFYKEFFFVEPLAGIGVRSIRLALESLGRGIANDLDPLSYYYIKRNIALNNVEEQVKPYNTEANTLLNSLRTNGFIVDYIDIDPYGSPIPFIDSAAYAAAKGGLVGVTATDTGPLNCSYPEKCYRRYGAYCFKTDFSKEMGLRILIGSIVRRAAAHDVAFKPILGYYMGYYYRVYFSVERKASSAHKLLENIGYILYEPRSYYRKYIHAPTDICDGCRGGNPVVIGPLWIGSLSESSFLKEVTRKCETPDYMYRDVCSFLEKLAEELSINIPYYRVDKLFGLLKKNMVRIDKLIDTIRAKGYLAYRTHFDPRGLKTNTPYEELLDILRSIS